MQNSEFKPAVLNLNIDLESYPAVAKGLGKLIQHDPTFNYIIFYYIWVMLLHSRDTTIRIHIYVETKSRIMTNEHTSFEKYTSHTFIRKGCERVVYER